jgi:shikimate kinase
MTIFVIGPSRAGKSTLIRAVLPEFPSLRLLDLDAEETSCVGGWEDRWRRDSQRIRTAEAEPGDVIIDVGAGSLETAEGRQFVAERGLSTVAVLAPWEVVFLRHPGRDREEFRRVEYSPERERVYRTARFQVDSSHYYSLDSRCIL